MLYHRLYIFMCGLFLFVWCVKILAAKFVQLSEIIIGSHIMASSIFYRTFARPIVNKPFGKEPGLNTKEIAVRIDI